MAKPKDLNLKFPVNKSGRNYDLNLTNAPMEMIEALVKQGAAILIQRCTAGLDKDEDADKFAIEEQKIVEKLNSGTWKPGSNGGGGRTPTGAVENELRGILRVVFMNHRADGEKAADIEKLLVSEEKRRAKLRELIRFKLSLKGEHAPEVIVAAEEAQYKRYVETAEKRAEEAKKAAEALSSLDLGV